MLHGSGLTTSFAALAHAGIVHVLNNLSAPVVSGTSAASMLPVVVGIGLLVILGIIVAAIVFVRRKQTEIRRGQIDRAPGGVPSSNQEYSSAMGGMQQEPWPWAKKITPQVGYNPTTPVPEILRAPAVPVTPVPAISGVSAYNAVPMQNMPEASRMPAVSMAPAIEMPDLRRGVPRAGSIRTLRSPADGASDMQSPSNPVSGLSSPADFVSMTPVPEMPGVHGIGDQALDKTALYGRSAADFAPMTPVLQVPVTPPVPTRHPLQPPPVPVPDAELEAIMRQVQVGLFALPRQYRGQKDQHLAP